MSYYNNGKMSRKPTHPGEMLREDFLPEYGLSVARFAESIGVSRQTVNELIRERRALSPEMALRLARYFGNSPIFWLNVQQKFDLWKAARQSRKQIELIAPLEVV